MVYLKTIVYHKLSKLSIPSLPTENHKGKRKVINDKAICKTIEKKCRSDDIVSRLEHKIMKLE